MHGKTPHRPVPHRLIGEAKTATKPGADPALYGTATLKGPDEVEVRSYQTFRVIYTVGKLGLDDTGGIRVAFRFISDAGLLQTADPTAPNYVTARSSGEGRLHLKYEKNGGQRPWNETLTVHQRGGYLKPGETIEIVFGDTSGGSLGLLMPTFYDGAREFRVMADVQATGNFIALPDHQLTVPVVAGDVFRYVAVLPTMRRPGQAFCLGIKAEDAWGNPTARGPCRLELRPSIPVDGLPAEIEFAPVSGAVVLEGLKAEAGRLTVDIHAGERKVAEAGPLLIRDGELVHYWGDLHGQTGETVGTNSAEHYLDFARNKAFLDVTSHQANDFQITAEFWAHLNELTRSYDEPGRFTAFPGYEWSGNTAVGGDHNVFFLDEGATIHRCSHALVEDTSDAETDAFTLTDLFEKLKSEPTEVVMYAHVGGRYANIEYDHDPELEAAVEVHSAWGSFEWILTDGFDLGRRVGVVCNSDGHKGRPGASFPGASAFGAYGGLTCFLARENTRAAIFEAIRRRHTYGTTGCRTYVALSIDLPDGGVLYHRNPDTGLDANTEEVTSCLMGDIVRSNGPGATLNLHVAAHAGIASIDVLDGKTVLETWRPYAREDLGNRIRVTWSGAEYRGRGRNTVWRGRAHFFGAEIRRLRTFNTWNPDLLFRQNGSNEVIWDTVTTGNMIGFDAWLGAVGSAGHLDIRTGQGNLDLTLADIGFEPTVLDAGGLEKRLCVQRMPEAALPQEARITRTISIRHEGDTPIWVRVTTEDGNQIWTSPAYLFRN